MQWLKEQFEAGVPVTQLVSARSTQTDVLLQSLWQKLGLAEHKQLSLVAVGGYGRGELHPKSDIDILILRSDELSDPQAQLIGDFITLLWDIKLDIGQSVRSINECLTLGSDDITIATNLLESRLLAGNAELYQALTEAVTDDNFWPSAKFFQAKKQEQQIRHAQYKDSAYSLEPDLKANPGGLRDMQTICWVAGRHFGSSDLGALADNGFLTQAEYRELQDSQDFLWRVRFALHLLLTKADNRLLFDRQLSVAQSLGYDGEHNAPVERLMKQFFQTIRRVSELNEMLLQLFDEAILGNTAMDVRVLDDDFVIRGTRIDATATDLLLKQPDKILDLFLHIADTPSITGIYSSTLRQLRESRRRLSSWLEDIPECRKKFRRLVKHPHVAGLPITLMHRYGILTAYWPAWSRIVGQMQFDLFHAYPVDEHTHRVIKNINNFTSEAARDIFPVCSMVYPRLERPDLLFLAALFHDIAKGRLGDHSQLGAIDAEAFCLNHGFCKSSSRTVAWLVEHHLLMSVTAQRRDIYDPEVITEFAKKVRDQRHLDMLLCLTVADICATNDDLWNSWKGTLMRELYTATKKALIRGLENPVDVRGIVREKQDAAMELLIEKSFSVEQIKALWKRFRVDYFLRHTPEQIAWHSEHLWGHGNDQPLVMVSRRASRGGTEIFIHSKDIPHLFASVAAELDQKNLTIHDAQIMSSRDGYVLDTFIVVERDGQPISSGRRHELKENLTKMLHFGRPIDVKARRVPRQVQQFKVRTRVEFIPTKGNRTLMELVTLDRPGLLARIGAVLQSMNYSIQSSKITTIGEKAEDFFSICNDQRCKLSEAEKTELKARLESTLDQPNIHP
jgi:[protein-PII] uridylyltransferase